MILIYIDEAGTNYKHEDALYIDGPFLIFGAMFVSEDVYWNLERLACDLIDEFFGIENWRKSELHATDIWNGKGLAEKFEIPKRRRFFDEIIQLFGKFGISYLFSFQEKNPKQSIEERNRDMAKVAHSFLTGIEHILADMHQSGILVCDATQGCEKLTLKNIFELDVSRQNLSTSEVLLRQFFAMTSWRIGISSDDLFIVQPRFPFESKSVYLIDRVHYLFSDDSLFLQMCDILTYVVQRCLVFDYLKVVDEQRAEEDKVPVSKHGLSTISEKITYSYYIEKDKDIAYHRLEPQSFGYILEFYKMNEIRERIPKHYQQIKNIDKYDLKPANSLDPQS